MDTKEPMPIQSDGRLKIVVHTPGDGVVLRRSALMDKREEKNWVPGWRLQAGGTRCCLFSPIIRG